MTTIDLQTQRQAAGKIEALLLDETPLIIPYFVDELNATKSNVHSIYARRSDSYSSTRPT